MTVSWEIAFGIMGSIGALATAGAFIAIFRKDQQKQDQIDRLAEIAQYHEKYLNVISTPNFKIETLENYNEFEITNTGQQFTLERIEIISPSESKGIFDYDITINKGHSQKLFVDTSPLKQIHLKIFIKNCLGQNHSFDFKN